jgi:hypothetical protein
VADVVELLQHQLQLLRQFAWAWSRPELDCLDEGTLELLVQPVSSLDLEHVVSECDQVRHCLHLQFFLALKEGLYLPLLVVARELLFVPGSG